MTDDRPLLDVVCAVIQKPNGEFLLAQRPSGKVYAGYWEFPGGKVDAGESVSKATARELKEELGLVVEESYPWLTRKFSYPHAHVRLHFRRVTCWRNEPHGREMQSFAWQRISNINVNPLLPANGPILSALALPTIYGITHAEELGEGEMLHRLEAALDKDLRLIQVRENNWPRERIQVFARKVIDLARRFQAKVLINSDWELTRTVQADGVHLTSNQLMTIDVRPDTGLCAASCHNESELLQAEKLGLDFVVLGPVLPTPSHPGNPTLGWDRFADLARNYSLPIFALGGLNTHHQEAVWQRGGHGIAMLRNAWPA